MAKRDEAAKNTWRMRPLLAGAAEIVADGHAGADFAEAYDDAVVDADTAGTEAERDTASAVADSDQDAAREVDIAAVADSYFAVDAAPRQQKPICVYGRHLRHPERRR